MFDWETELRVGLKKEKKRTERMKLKYMVTIMDNIYNFIFQNEMI